MIVRADTDRKSRKNHKNFNAIKTLAIEVLFKKHGVLKACQIQMINFSAPLCNPLKNLIVFLI